MNFSDLGLCPELSQAVADLGYTAPTPIQEKSIPYVLMGRDILGSAQTGTGKTHTVMGSADRVRNIGMVGEIDCSPGKFTVCEAKMYQKISIEQPSVITQYVNQRNGYAS